MLNFFIFYLIVASTYKVDIKKCMIIFISTYISLVRVEFWLCDNLRSTHGELKDKNRVKFSCFDQSAVQGWPLARKGEDLDRISIIQGKVSLENKFYFNSSRMLTDFIVLFKSPVWYYAQTNECREIFGKFIKLSKL